MMLLVKLAAIAAALVLASLVTTVIQSYFVLPGLVQ